MKHTTDQVWEFMIGYQRERGMPPTMDDIVMAVDSLNWRSSARYTLRNLIEEGRVVEVSDPNCSRRHRAVERIRPVSPFDNGMGARCSIIPTVHVED